MPVQDSLLGLWMSRQRALSARRRKARVDSMELGEFQKLLSLCLRVLHQARRQTLQHLKLWR